MENSTKVVTGVCVLDFLNCFEPKALAGGRPKWSVCLLVPKSDSETLAGLRSAIRAAYERRAEELKRDGRSVPPFWTMNDPIMDGDFRRPLDEAFRGRMFLNAVSHDAPEVVDADGREITVRSEMYDGVLGRASVEAYVYDGNGRMGVAFRLLNLQKIADGKPLNGKSRAIDDFAS